MVKAFIANVTERAVGEEVLKSLTPAQQVIKIVNEELTELMGGGDSRVRFASSRLRSSCCAASRARAKRPMRQSSRTILKKLDRRPLLVACDIYRPAAVEQLKIVGAAAEVPVFSRTGKSR